MSEPASSRSSIERHYLWLNEQRGHWFPFFSLKPATYNYITLTTVMIYSIAFFLPVSLIGAVGVYYFARRLGLWVDASVVVGAAGVIFPWAGSTGHQYIAGHMWNRRALMLRSAPGFVISGDVDSSGHSSLTSTNPYRAPNTVYESASIEQSAPLPLRHLLYAIEFMFCFNLLVFVSRASNSWLLYSLPTSAEPISFARNVLQFCPAAGVLMLLASVVLLTVSFKPIAVISALLKLAIGAAQLNLSGYFLWATINSTASNGLLIPALIWGTWIACAVIELISTWVQYSFSAGSAR